MSIYRPNAPRERLFTALRQQASTALRTFNPPWVYVDVADEGDTAVVLFHAPDATAVYGWRIKLASGGADYYRTELFCELHEDLELAQRIERNGYTEIDRLRP